MPQDNPNILLYCIGALFTIWLAWMVLCSFVMKHAFDNIPGPSATESFVAGDMMKLWDRVRGWTFQKDISETYGSVARLHGPFGSKMLYIYDPKALKGVSRRQAIYTHPDWVTSANTMIVGRGLLSTEGEQHRKQRRLLNPVFTQDNIDSIFPIFQEVVDRLQQAIHVQVKDGSQEVDLLRWATRASLELISRSGLGCSFDPLVKLPDASAKVFCEALKELIPSVYPINHWRVAAPIVETLFPSSIRGLLGRIVPHKQFQATRTVCDTIWDTAKDIFSSRRESIREEGSEGLARLEESHDMLSALLKSSFSKEEANRLSEEELIAQIGSMLFAATDTTSTLICRALHAFALNPDMQNRLRSELHEAQAEHGQDLPCDILQDLPLLDAIVRETLRMYPAVNILSRVAQKDDCLSLSEPIRGKDGTLITEVIVPKGTMVIVGLLASNMNKALWGEDAHEWKPERWLHPLPQALLDAQIPGLFANTMSFGGGKHSCIGYRFALMAMKVMLVRLIANFKFSLTDRKIVWNFSGVNYPSMDKDDVVSSMLLRVEKIRSQDMS